MAEYFTQFSATLNLGNEQAAATAQALYDDMMERGVDPNSPDDTTPEFDLVMQVEDDGTPLAWFTQGDGQGNIDHVTVFVQELSRLISMTGRWGFTWSHSCSKPRVHAFGGGAVIVDMETGEAWHQDSRAWLVQSQKGPMPAGDPAPVPRTLSGVQSTRTNLKH